MIYTSPIQVTCFFLFLFFFCSTLVSSSTTQCMKIWKLVVSSKFDDNVSHCPLFYLGSWAAVFSRCAWPWTWMWRVCRGDWMIRTGGRLWSQYGCILRWHPRSCGCWWGRWTTRPLWKLWLRGRCRWTRWWRRGSYRWQLRGSDLRFALTSIITSRGCRCNRVLPTYMMVMFPILVLTERPAISCSVAATACFTGFTSAVPTTL